MVTLRSYAAPSSVGSCFHRASAASQSAPLGACGRSQDIRTWRRQAQSTGARAAFNRHVAHRHAFFHAERADGAAAVFEDAARAAAHADSRNQRQDDILGRYARFQRPVHPHFEASSTSAAAGTGWPARAPLRSEETIEGVCRNNYGAALIF